jgi:carbon-monoxide dehydrogenase large subunit
MTEQAEHRAIGQPVPRAEDRPPLTGHAAFVSDHEPTGCLHVAFVRSPVAHADIIANDAAFSPLRES